LVDDGFERSRRGAVAAPGIEENEVHSPLHPLILTRRSRNQTGKSVTMPEWVLNY